MKHSHDLGVPSGRLTLPPFDSLQLPAPSASSRSRLSESFEAVVNSKHDTQLPMLCSPLSVSTPIETRTGSQPSRRTPAATLSIGSSPHTPRRRRRPTLNVPQFARSSSGGWFDSTSWVFIIVWSELEHMSLEEAEMAMFRREGRPEYGENHISTRSRKRGELNVLEDADMAGLTGSRGRANENHMAQERERRFRHMILQKISDECTSTFVYELSERILPRVKDYIKQHKVNDVEVEIFGQASLQPPSRHMPATTTAKRTGKDDQLLSAVLCQYLYAVVTLLERDARIAAEEEQKETERKFRDLQAYFRDTCAKKDADHWRQLEMNARLEAENESLRRQRHLPMRRHDQLVKRQTEATMSFAQPLAPAVSINGKRSISDVEGNTSDRIPLNGVKVAKKRCYIPDSPPRISRPRSQQPQPRQHLPPSPTPSCDGVCSSCSLPSLTPASSDTRLSPS